MKTVFENFATSFHDLITITLFPKKEHRTHEHSCGVSEERNVQKSVKENKIYLHFGEKQAIPLNATNNSEKKTRTAISTNLMRANVSCAVCLRRQHNIWNAWSLLGMLSFAGDHMFMTFFKQTVLYRKSRINCHKNMHRLQNKRRCQKQRIWWYKDCFWAFDFEANSLVCGI